MTMPLRWFLPLFFFACVGINLLLGYARLPAIGGAATGTVVFALSRRRRSP